MNNLSVTFNGNQIPESHIHVKFKGKNKCIVTCKELPHYAVKAVKDGASQSVVRTKKSAVLLAKCSDHEKAMIETTLNGLEARALAKLSERSKPRMAKCEGNHSHGRCHGGHHSRLHRHEEKSAPAQTKPAQTSTTAPAQTQSTQTTTAAPAQQPAQTQAAQTSTTAPAQTQSTQTTTTAPVQQPAQTQAAQTSTTAPAQTQSTQTTTTAPTQTQNTAAQKPAEQPFSFTPNIQEKHGKRKVTMTGSLNGVQGSLVMKQKGNKKPTFVSKLDSSSELYKKLKAEAEKLIK